MNPNVLSAAQIEHFIERGYAKLDEAFPHAQALAAQDFLWNRLAERDGVHKNDPPTWTEPMIRLNETFSEPVFAACATERLKGAVEDLLGPGRWRERENVGRWGWWPVNFSQGADVPWTVPTGGWHWDGQHFRHFVDSPDQGLLLLCMFSDIGPRGGGTLVAEGSHQVVARILARHPDGSEHRAAITEVLDTHPWLAELTARRPLAPGHEDRVQRFMNETHTDEEGTQLRVSEITAQAGDVFLCHPFLIHAASPNHSGVPRFMCNRTTPLRERMNLDRADGNYSPVEISIRKALSA
jgi:hypothetical protein